MFAHPDEDLEAAGSSPPSDRQSCRMCVLYIRVGKCCLSQIHDGFSNIGRYTVTRRFYVKRLRD